MQEETASLGEPGQENTAQFDDIEWELTCSEREASVGCASFEDLDFASAARRMAERSKKAGPDFSRIVR